MPRSRTYFFLIPYLILYVGFGLYTELQFMKIVPLPEFLFYDALIYVRALHDTVSGGSPYAIQSIGAAYLYPPQSLLFVALLTSPFMASKLIGILFVLACYLLFVAYGTWCLIRHTDTNLKRWWWLFVITIFSAPMLETFHTGQINPVIFLLTCLVYVYLMRLPWISGLLLSVAIAIKLTPLLLVSVIADRKSIKKFIPGILIGLILWTLATGMIFGWQHFEVYLTALRQLAVRTLSDTNCQSFSSITGSLGIVSGRNLEKMQKGFTVLCIALCGISSLLSFCTKERHFVFAVATITMTLAPNIIWYHHYIFTLPALFVLLLHYRTQLVPTTLILAGLLVMQIDRNNSLLYWSHGLLTFGFLFITILSVIVVQVRSYRLLKVSISN